MLEPLRTEGLLLLYFECIEFLFYSVFIRQVVLLEPQVFLSFFYLAAPPGFSFVVASFMVVCILTDCLSSEPVPSAVYLASLSSSCGL